MAKQTPTNVVVQLCTQYHSAKRHQLTVEVARRFLFRLAPLIALAAVFGLPLCAQSSATDSSTQASPATATAPPLPAPTDASREASPVSAPPTTDAVRRRVHLQVRLSAAVTSATAHNGDTVRAKLTDPLRTVDGKTLAAGSTVLLSLVAVAPAGVMTSYGEVTLQIIRIGRHAVLSNTRTIRGAGGKRILPDSAPAKGTQAVLPAGTLLDFYLPPWPAPATHTPHDPKIGDAETLPAQPH
jgi:hypothetical protein